MSRPEGYDDLPDYQREGHLIARIPSDHITRYPSLGMHLLAAIAEADRLGLVINDDRIEVPPTDEELDAALAQQQRSWDTAHEWYAAAVNGDEVETWKRNTVNNWARKEGRDPIDWDAYDAEARAAK